MEQLIPIMAHLFTLDTNRQPQTWKLIPSAEGDSFSLPHDVLIRPPGGQHSSQLGGACWYILSPAGAQVRVNGETLFLGTRSLKHRDEILVDGARFFFSTERLAVIEPLPELDHAVHCARCKQPVAAGVLAVRCPGCGAWHHQNEQFGCWAYAAKCALCDFATEMSGGYRWTPDQEGWL